MTDPRPRQRVRFRAPTRVRGGGRYNPGEHAEFEGKLQYDLFYVLHGCAALDLKIAAETVLHVLTLKGR